MVYITESASQTINEAIDQRFLRYQMQSIARIMLPDHRVKICLRYHRDKQGTVDIFKHRQTQKAFYGGLMICGNGWICPVCASKISERRRVELRSAFDQHLQKEGQATMLTLTFSHTRFDKLQDLITAFRTALKKFQSGRKYAALRSELGYLGTVRAFEITYGEINGWHPHVHLLVLHKNEIDPWEREAIEDRYYELWDIACEASGLTTSREHGLKMDDAKEADSYITKWGEIRPSKWRTDQEMTKANIKKGRRENMTPFDFLRYVVEDGDLKYEPQFQEFSAAVKGMPQLYWSPGLKKNFEIIEKSDEEIANAKEEPADLLGGLSWEEWKFIIRYDLRAKLLNYIEQYGLEDALMKIGLNKKDALSKASLNKNL